MYFSTTVHKSYSTCTTSVSSNTDKQCFSNNSKLTSSKWCSSRPKHNSNTCSSKPPCRITNKCSPMPQTCTYSQACISTMQSTLLPCLLPSTTLWAPHHQNKSIISATWTLCRGCPRNLIGPLLEWCHCLRGASCPQWWQWIRMPEVLTRDNCYPMVPTYKELVQTHLLHLLDTIVHRVTCLGDKPHICPP